MVKNKGKFILMAWCFLLSCKGSNYTCTLFHIVFTVWGFYFLTLRYWNLFMLPSASKSPSPLFSGLSNSLLLWQALLFRQNPNQNNQKNPWLAIMLRWGKTICKLKKAHVHAHTQIKQRNHLKAIMSTVFISQKKTWDRLGRTNSKWKNILLIFFFWYLSFKYIFLMYL